MPDLDQETLAAFILTHGRPERQLTEKHLRKAGFTGPIFYVIDDEDETGPRYRELYGEERVITFSKEEISKSFDQADNFTDRRSIVYARNACFEIARSLGFRYFLQLDDDYHEFKYSTDGARKQKISHIRDLDRVLDALLRYFKEIPAHTIALGQGGDVQGGWRCTDLKTVKTKRKAMNSFLCDVERPFTFTGRINEDVNTYVSEGHRGALFLTIYAVFLTQATTQKQAGGMTDIYQAAGTYTKSFYTVMLAPSCVTITAMGYAHSRLHHKIAWRYAVPKILSEKHRRA